MVVFELQEELKASDTMSHRYYPFSFEGRFSQMKITYSYTPKRYEDKPAAKEEIVRCYARYGLNATEKDIEAELPLNNLITISLDKDGEYIGGAHRHNNDAVYTVSEQGSSPGFCDTAVTGGLWRIALSAHCILSPSVTVRVKAEVL